MSEGELANVLKLDYAEKFDFLLFFLLLEKFDLDKFQGRKVGKNTGQAIREKITCRYKGRLDPSFVDKHSLDSDSLLSE